MKFNVQIYTSFHRQQMTKPDGGKRIKQLENAVVVGNDLST